MSETKKKKFNPWVPAVVLGVVAILFSVYAVQSQSDLLDAKKEIELMKSQAVDYANKINELEKRATGADQAAKASAEKARQVEEDCKKPAKRK